LIVSSEKKIFVISDTHFGHPGIINLCFRPYKTIQEHDYDLINKWNSVVSPNDIVYHLGDFAYKTSVTYTNKIVNELNGQIIVIKGNHDSLVQKIADQKIFSESKFKLIPGYYELENFTYVDKNKDTQLGPMYILSHYPMKSWNQKHRNSVMLYGHVHGQLLEDHSLSFDVGVDCWNYTPVSMEQIRKKVAIKIPNWLAYKENIKHKEKVE
jgi:calcineurin-like phosphoesterase family protein